MTPNRDLIGKTMVVTGATSGIGKAIARALALRGAHVIGVGRSPSRCAELAQAVRQEDPAACISFAVADLSSQRQVRGAAADIRAMAESAGGGKIDVLVNNAASVSSWYTATEDGYELQFAVNHLASFLLTHELMPLLRLAPAARILTISSSSHYRTNMRWSDMMYRKHYSCLMAYKQSKLANVLFVAELNRRLGGGSSIRAYAVDPGLVNTDIGLKGTGGIENWVWRRRQAGGVSPEQGAATAIFLASEPSLERPDAIYWKNCRPTLPSRPAQSRADAARLWAISEQLCGIAWGDAHAARLSWSQAQEQQL